MSWLIQSRDTWICIGSPYSNGVCIFDQVGVGAAPLVSASWAPTFELERMDISGSHLLDVCPGIAEIPNTAG